MNQLLFLAHGDHWHIDNIWLALGAGLLAGVLHTFTGPDHLAALMPLSVNRRLKAAWLGVRWGIGHSIGVFIVAVIFLAGRQALDLTPVEEWGERVVAMVLIVLGGWGLWRTSRQQLHVHAHSHEGGPAHAHLHVHDGQPHDPTQKGGWQAHAHKHAAMGAGALHGVAGMAHLLVLIVAIGAPTMAQSAVFLASFAAGSILSMATFAAVFGMVTAAIGSRSAGMVKATSYFAAIGCMLIGIYWLFGPMIWPDEEDHGHDHAMAAPAVPGFRQAT
ncbi:MAG: hypothetical protein KF754_14840 [Planctomycetes bacterium]|nr:hypothetical protein [Planctomycetota bacterium]